MRDGFSWWCLLPVWLLLTASLLMAEPILPEIKLPPQAREATAEEIAKLLQEQKDVGLLDVRTADEVASLGRLPGAKHLDFFREDFGKSLGLLSMDPTKTCVVYCALGGRARRAASLLAEAGFQKILVLKDGFNAWKKAGYPTEGGSPAK